MDMRTKKTERAITQALFHFLNEKDLNKITVREICDYAEINRGTFYLHYLDIYDLMDKVEQKMVDRIYDERHSSTLKTLEENINKPFDYIQRHKDEYKTLIVKHKSNGFVSKLKNKILSDSMPLLEKLMPDTDKEVLKNVSFFLIGGSVAMLYAWLENDCKTPYSELLCVSETLGDYIHHQKSQKAKKSHF